MSAQAAIERRIIGLGLDRRERALLASIARHWDQHGYGPTVRELQQDLGLSSLSVAAYWIGRLERRGLVVKTAGAARSIRVVGMTEERPGYDGKPSGAGEAAADLDWFQRAVGEWADRTFPESSRASITAHLGEEVTELQSVSQGTGWFADAEEEAADCLLLLLHYAHKQGFSLLGAARAKHAINQRRTWEADHGGKGYWKHCEGSPPWDPWTDAVPVKGESS